MTWHGPQCTTLTMIFTYNMAKFLLNNIWHKNILQDKYNDIILTCLTHILSLINDSFKTWVAHIIMRLIFWE